MNVNNWSIGRVCRIPANSSQNWQGFFPWDKNKTSIKNIDLTVIGNKQCLFPNAISLNVDSENLCSVYGKCEFAITFIIHMDA